MKLPGRTMTAVDPPSVGHTEYQHGDEPDGNAIVRNNIDCYPATGHQSTLVRVIAPDSSVLNNISHGGRRHHGRMRLRTRRIAVVACRHDLGTPPTHC